MNTWTTCEGWRSFNRSEIYTKLSNFLVGNKLNGCKPLFTFILSTNKYNAEKYDFLLKRKRFRIYK